MDIYSDAHFGLICIVDGGYLDYQDFMLGCDAVKYAHIVHNFL